MLFEMYRERHSRRRCRVLRTSAYRLCSTLEKTADTQRLNVKRTNPFAPGPLAIERLERELARHAEKRSTWQPVLDIESFCAAVAETSKHMGPRYRDSPRDQVDVKQLAGQWFMWLLEVLADRDETALGEVVDITGKRRVQRAKALARKCRRVNDTLDRAAEAIDQERRQLTPLGLPDPTRHFAKARRVHELRVRQFFAAIAPPGDVYDPKADHWLAWQKAVDGDQRQRRDERRERRSRQRWSAPAADTAPTSP